MERERNEPPLEAGVIDPPGAPYIGCPGDKGCPTIHCTSTLHTVAEFDYWGLVSTVACISTVPSLVLCTTSWSLACPILPVLGVLVFVF
jgi:hypothetical protein